MTIIRLTSSGRAIQVVTDEGYVYQTSTTFLQGLLWGKAKGNFITTNRMPFNVAPDRFKPSELYDPDGKFQGEARKTLDRNNTTTTNDAISVKTRKEKEVKKGYVDKKVW